MSAANRWRVTFLPDGKSAEVVDGASLVDASVEAGVRLVAPCNGKGTCGKCGVQFQAGLPATIPADERFFDSAELENGWRLACMHRVHGETVLFAAPATLGKVDFGPSMAQVRLNPNVRKVLCRIDAIRGDILTWTDLKSCAEGTLEEAPTLGVLKTLSGLSYRAGMELTIVVRGGKAEILEEGDTRIENYGLALDIGTTTVAGSLLDLNTGEEVARHSALNRQCVYGADVMSRLTAVHDNREVLPVLQQLAADTVNEILDRMLSDCGVRRECIYEVTLVGNSCMHHIFLGVDPLPLAYAPYDALVLCALAARAGEVGIKLNPDAALYALPNVASFIGADALGAILATGLHLSETIKCLVDIGTNGEIVLGSRERMIACSTPAGPAFEGATISCGMIASEGAIHKVEIGDTVTVETIGGAKPRGLTGSGLIDIGSGLRRVGLLNEMGKFVIPAEASQLSPAIAERLVDGPHGKSFLIAKSYGKNLCLTQRDLRELQLAKGIIYAGIEALKAEMGIGNDDIDEIELAGTFGSYLNVQNALIIGLVPKLPIRKVHAVGNAALVGAKMCLLSVDKRDEAEQLARRIEHVELPLRQDFQDIFMQAMLFPPLALRRSAMAEYQILYWKDLPAQVRARDGGCQAKRVLSERFQNAIDLRATQEGATEEDAYLAGWKWGEWQYREGSADQVVEQVVAEIESSA